MQYEEFVYQSEIESAQVNPHDKFYSDAGNIWEVLSVEGKMTEVIRHSYFSGDKQIFPPNETPYCFNVASLLGMQRL